MTQSAPSLPTARFGPDQAEAMLAFWIAAGPQRWFAKDADFDRRFTDGFAQAHADARADAEAGLPVAEARYALGRVLLLDQYPRNAFRGSARAFATDALAVRDAEQALAQGFDMAVAPELRAFFYLPFMHAESLPLQDRSVALNAPLGADSQRFAEVHRDIIARFGRFPHRNAVLGRSTTAPEQAFLDSGGFAG